MTFKVFERPQSRTKCMFLNSSAAVCMALVLPVSIASAAPASNSELISSLAGQWTYTSVLGSDARPSNCFGSLRLPASKPNGGLSEGAVLSIKSVDNGAAIELSFNSQPGGQISEKLSAGDSTISDGKLKKTVEFTNNSLKIKIHGSNLQEFTTSEDYKWEFSKTKQGDLKIKSTSKVIGFFPQDSKSICVLKKN